MKPMEKESVGTSIPALRTSVPAQGLPIFLFLNRTVRTAYSRTSNFHFFGISMVHQLSVLAVAIFAATPTSSVRTSATITGDAVAACKGALRDSCESVQTTPKKCSSCLTAHSTLLLSQGCSPGNLSSYCVHGVCKAAMQRTADEMASPPNATAKSVFHFSFTFFLCL